MDAVISSIEAESKMREKEEDEQAEEWGDMMKLVGSFLRWLIKAVFRFM